MSDKAEHGSAELVVSAPMELVGDSSEIDMQVATAQKYKRSIKLFKNKVLELATIDKETAEECWYALPRGGKAIEGPSIRFAEIVSASYGNLRVAGRHINTGDKVVTCEGLCWDLENNVAVRVAVNRRIIKRDGSRFDEDMINVTIAAAISIAIRNAVFKVVPRALFQNVLTEIKGIAMGSGRTITATRAAIMAHFASLKVSEAQVLALIGRKGVEDITLEDATMLRGVATAIKEGTTTIGEVFSEDRAAPVTGKIPRSAIKPGKAKHTAPGEAQPSMADRLASARLAVKESIAKADDAGLSDEAIADMFFQVGIEGGTDTTEDLQALQDLKKTIDAAVAEL